MIDFYENQLTEHDVGYLAGIIDGEGCIHISRPITRHKDCKSPIYQTYISVTNTDLNLLNWLQEKLGGHIRTIKTDKGSNVIRKPLWRWYCCIKRIHTLCKILIPFSIIKKRQFEIMYEIRGTYQNQATKGKRGIQKVPDCDIDFRHKCYLELKELHIRPNLRHQNLDSIRIKNGEPTSQTLGSPAR